MARPFEYVPIRLSRRHEQAGKREYRQMKRIRRIPRDDMAWAGLAAEWAARQAIDAGRAAVTVDPEGLDYDFGLRTVADGPLVRVEMKVRAVREGWTDPRLFDWVVVPTHDGREPVKPAADLVLVGWYSYSRPRRLWLLGALRGLAEFQERAVFYGEGEPLPRGGWAPRGGAYCLEPEKLRRVPPGLAKEDR